MVGSQSLLLILGVVLLLFGGKKLPELAGSLGKSMKEFKKSVETEPAEADPPAPALRACGGCNTSLQAEWTHCPRCGAAVPAAPLSQPKS